jgi:hypothetical protein
MSGADYSYEIDYWGDCCNTFDEEQKHYIYARLMGIPTDRYSFDAIGCSVLDVGGGPASMLLKCVNLKKGKVIDPIPYPEWTRQRYAIKGIDVMELCAEQMEESGWDEVWIYNCLQHVIDPGLVIMKAAAAAHRLRLFEWIDMPPHTGHPHELTKEKLDAWVGAAGNTINLSEAGCFGRAYFV